MDHFDEESIAQIIEDPETGAIAAEALSQIRVTRESDLPAAEGLDMAAKLLHRERGEVWVEQLKVKGQLKTFVAALRSLGLTVKGWTSDWKDVTFNNEKLALFLNRVDTFRCKINVGGMVKGSGTLVGPSSALTAWHVISTSPPGTPAVDVEIMVELADGRTIPAVPLPVSSPCGDVEWPPGYGKLPKSDDELHDRHDVALLRLKEPAGIRLSYAPLASPAYAFGVPAKVVLVSHPDGEWRGVEFARLRKLKNLTARWGYDVEGTSGGSSGGGCFDTGLALTGIHQGRVKNGGRLVPLIRFDNAVRQAILNDVIPQVLWSLDGTPDSDLVVGRDGFFKGYHAAMQGPDRVRGLWVRRVDLEHDVAGLPFSFQLLAGLVARSPKLRLVRVNFDIVVKDFPDELARRVNAAGLVVSAPDAAPGVSLDHTEPEAVAADRSHRIAQALEEVARVQDVTLWVFFDHPSAVFGDELRWALSAFVDQAMRCEHLRIVLAGYEAMQMPGALFQESFDALGDGAPGLQVEYLTDVHKNDVRNLIATAARDLNRTISSERIDEWVAEALKDLKPINNYYDSKIRLEIARRLQPKIQQLRDEENQA